MTLIKPENLKPPQAYEAVLDVAAGLGSIDKNDLDLGELMMLAIAYGAIYGIVDKRKVKE